MSRKLRLAPLIGLMVAGSLLLVGCDKPVLGRNQASPSVTATPAATTSTTPSSTPSPTETGLPDNGQAGIEDSDGALTVLPMVTGTDVLPTADTTNDVRTPATYKDALKCGPVQNWQELVDCVGGLQWYIDGVNARKGKTGFGWDDVLKWAKDTKDYDTRAIVVYNSPGISEQDARARAKDVVGNGNEDKLPVVYKNTCIINTRGFGHEQMQDFVDCRSMVRVSLVPIAYGTDGKPGFPANLSESLKSGVFVDCFNVWWLPKKVVPGGPAPTPTPTPPPSTPPPLTSKDPKDDVTPPNGVTKLPAGAKTDGQESKKQQQSGETSGNATDNKAGEGTKSGDTTSDTGKGTGASGASSGGDDSSKATTDPKNTNHDDGGTGGDTEISDPDAGG